MIRIEGRMFGPGDPLIIAEVSCNHAGSWAQALNLIQEASHAGAHAVKFQLYEPEDMTADTTHPAFRTDSKWGTTSLWELYSAARTPYKWAENLVSAARHNGLIPMFSVFSKRGIEVARKAGAEVVKVASVEAAWPEFIGEVARFSWPVFVSDGAVDAQGWQEVERLTEGLPLVRMRCVSRYPANALDYAFGDVVANGKPWGLSLHAVEFDEIPAIATALGATAIEAHIMLPRERYSDTEYERVFDREFSLRPDEFFRLARQVRLGRYALKLADRNATEIDGFRRRWVATTDLPVGKKINRGDLVALRCRQGVPADRYICGRTVVSEIKKHAPIYRHTVSDE